LNKDDKKTVLFIYRGLPTGGIETLILRKSKWLINNNYKVYLLVSQIGNMHDLLKKEGVNLIIDNNVLYQPNEIYFSQFISMYNRIINEVLDLNDIKVIGCFEPIDCFYGLILSKMLNTKFITGVFHPLAYCSNFDLSKFESARNLIHLLDENKCIHFMNEDVIKSHEDFYKLKIKNRAILSLAINIKEKKITTIKNKCFEILTIGRVVDYKGYFYGLISDYDEFYKEHSNSKLIIIGDGSEKKKLIKYAKTFKSYKEGKIEFLGTVDYDELDKYIYGASMVVGMGTSLLEMASAEIPAVIAPAFLDNNISNGFVFEDDNVGDIKNSCTKTYKDYIDILYNCNQAEYTEIAYKCREYVIEKYSMDNIMTRWIEMIDERKPIVMDLPLDAFVPKSPLKIFLSLGKRKMKDKLKKNR